jgi:alanyl-tRNA synthetase
MGYSRARCTKCKAYFWRHSETRQTCGDSNCEGKYSFIGNGISKDGSKMTYADAWKSFEGSFTTARIPCTSIERYPIVARWRNDVDFVAAGIFCFQPYCVTGELDPPANPLICPQFCARFNDLDNIGITGRHYSGFIMLGIQVFNSPTNYKFFKDECLEFNHKWLTQDLGVDPDEITYIEDVWAGGGNMGPSIEYFIRGMEVGNMVFMQYKTFHDGSREELDIKVIDTGIGLERVAWIYNGSPTSYQDTFKNAYAYLLSSLEMQCDENIWAKFGPYSCTLNIDETDDIDKTWQDISDKIGIDVATTKAAIKPIQDLYIVLDHTRTILITISDGALPSNVGGGGNVRNILRRVFMIMQRNGWWDKIGMDGFLQIFEHHKTDLEGIFGKFPEYKSFSEIIKVEYDRWKNSDEESVKKLDALLKKKKGKLDINDWITAMQSYGIAADKISEVVGAPIPQNLYYEIALRQEKTAKKAETILYNTVHIAETDNLYYHDNQMKEFDATILDVFNNVLQNNQPNIVILDRSAVYPTSGGQQHDTATMKILGCAGEYKVVDAIKVGKCVLHILDRPLEGYIEMFKGKQVHVKIDWERRKQL